MAVADEIFPQEQRFEYAETQYAAGWPGVFWGFGYAAKYLTKHRNELGALVDQTGLAIFFLQRHRVELGVKTVLSVVKPDALTNVHDLAELWSLCEDAVTEQLDRRVWETFLEPHTEFVELLDANDPRAMSFRYPADTRGAPAVRPRFIDLDALERYADDFHWAVEGLMLSIEER